MYTWILVAAGGALGAMARYALAINLVNAERQFPLPTFLANIIGSFLMGVLFIIIVEKGLLSDEWRHFLMVGMLGAFTTFSTFSIEALGLLEYHSWQSAGIYITASIIAGLSAVFVGMYITEKLI